MKADTQTIDILLLGSGGREHALAAKLAAPPRAGKLYIAPGNGGTASCGENVVLDDAILRPVAAFAQSHGCGLVVIGPEAPLVAGVADAVRAAGISLLWPGCEGARWRAPSCSPSSSWSVRAFRRQPMVRLPTRLRLSPTCASRAPRWS